ncbi:hypothetical protein BRC94_07230 [Halobacteriales archaeon QS_5_70_17]|nr:MAG: hypothetical protein BRC94_07230 [Halobacteriales archaeon QS_5_70_17]
MVLGVWSVLVALSLGVLVRDLRANNEALGSLMKYVWGFTVLYSGPIGLAVYWYSGRTQISQNVRQWLRKASSALSSDTSRSAANDASFSLWVSVIHRDRVLSTIAVSRAPVERSRPGSPWRGIDCHPDANV